MVFVLYQSSTALEGPISKKHTPEQTETNKKIPGKQTCSSRKIMNHYILNGPARKSGFIVIAN